MDNDIYGHINNVAYYSFFDTAANQFLIEHGLDIHGGPVIGLVVESKCQYHAPLAYPEPLRAGVRVDKLGNRAVTYGIAIFATATTAPPPTATSSTSSSIARLAQGRADPRANTFGPRVDFASQCPVT